jgi:hypothetical protein
MELSWMRLYRREGYGKVIPFHRSYSYSSLMDYLHSLVAA